VNAAEIKRQILESSDNTGIRRKVSSGETGMVTEDVIEMGDALERMTQAKGWNYVEAYILKRCNPAVILESDDQNIRLQAKTLMYLMQWVNEMILAKNDFVKKANAKTEEQTMGNNRPD
jgi:predicted nucleotide-binding protein (sugar kinase/HSP70/actin superfamily)